MVFSFLCQKNRFDVNKKFQLYFEYEMGIFDSSEASKPQDPVVVSDEIQAERPDQPLSKFKVWSMYYVGVINF